MSFGDVDFMADEHVVYSTSLHWMIFWRPAALFLIAVAAILFVSGSWIVFGNLFVPVAALEAMSLFMLYLSSEVHVTDQRVVGRAGWFSRQSLDVPLSEVEGIVVRQGALGRLFGYGTIVVSGAGGLRRRLARIREPIEFQRRLQEQMGA